VLGKEARSTLRGRPPAGGGLAGELLLDADPVAGSDGAAGGVEGEGIANGGGGGGEDCAAAAGAGAVNRFIGRVIPETGGELNAAAGVEAAGGSAGLTAEDGAVDLAFETRVAVDEVLEELAGIVKGLVAEVDAEAGDAGKDDLAGDPEAGGRRLGQAILERNREEDGEGNGEGARDSANDWGFAAGGERAGGGDHGDKYRPGGFRELNSHYT